MEPRTTTIEVDSGKLGTAIEVLTAEIDAIVDRVRKLSPNQNHRRRVYEAKYVELVALRDALKVAHEEHVDAVVASLLEGSR